VTGYARSRRGEAHHSARLTEHDVRELRRLVERLGVCVPCAGKVLGLRISRGSLWDAASYKTWRHVK